MARPGGGVGLLSIVIIALLPTAVGTENNSIYSKEYTVRWEVSEYGPCSQACGGGVQVRTVRCMRHPPWRNGVYSRGVEVAGTVCPLTPPRATRSCNNHMCSAHWTTGEWSECSQTCGVGSQTRQVLCESSLWNDQSYQVSLRECGGSQPPASRKCHVTDCPFGDKLEHHSIVSENYTLIQLHRIKKLKVNIGGQVNLLPGQSIVVKCPVKHYDRKLVYWSKGYKLVSFMGRVKSKSGGLHIRKADPTSDAGVYTCIAGDQTATITVKFVTKDDPLRKIYKKWIRKSKRSHQNHLPRSENNEGLRDNVLLTFPNINPEEPSQQRDQSQNSSHSLTYVSGDWSKCSATCGSQGHRKRKVSCSYVTLKYVKIVPDSECSRVGLVKPETIQVCSSERRCAVWRPGPWTQCRPHCGKIGRKVRYLTCVWESSGRPAFSACDAKKRPVTRKPCKPNPCPTDCQDRSRYCSIARLLNMCRYASFRRDCCYSCHEGLNSTS